MYTEPGEAAATARTCEDVAAASASTQEKRVDARPASAWGATRRRPHRRGLGAARGGAGAACGASAGAARRRRRGRAERARERWPGALELKGRPQAGRALRAEHLHEDPAGEGEGEEKVLLWRCVTVCS